MEAKLFLLIGVMVGRAFAVPELDTVEIGTAGNQSTTNSATFEDDFTGVQVLVRTKELHDTCVFRTPDGLTTEELHCNPPTLDCAAEHTFSERPAYWHYRAVFPSEFPERSCMIEVAQVILMDNGTWTVEITDSTGSLLEVTFTLNILGNSITGGDSPADEVDPGKQANMVAITRTPITNCNFESPDGLMLEVIPGDVSIHDKPAEDTRRPDEWKYSWFGYNSSDLNCGIRLMYVDPHDEGEWTVTTYKEDKPEMSHTFNLDVTDFMIVEEPLGTSNYSATEGEYASLIYKVSYPYDYCEFTTSDGKVLEPLKCNVQENIQSCIEEFGPVAGDVARMKAEWTYLYQAYNDTDLECGIQIPTVALADIGTWKVKIVSVVGEEKTAQVNVAVNGMELIEENYNAAVFVGEPLELIFRTDLIHDSCQFQTPQGPILNLTNGLPTQFPWGTIDDSRSPDWMYSWFGYNSSGRDCGMKIMAAEMADVGEWTVHIMKNTGTSIPHKFEVKEGTNTASSAGTTSNMGTGSTSNPGTGSTSNPGTGSTMDTTTNPSEVTTTSSADSIFRAFSATLVLVAALYV